MYTIKGFTTKKDINEQLSKAGVNVKLPFSATKFKAAKVPKGTLYDCDGKEQKVTKL